MLRKNNQRNIETKDAVRNGPGHVIFNHIAGGEELYNKVKMYATLTFEPGCGIGAHKHEKESEIICVLKGEADYIDDDKTYKIKEGDVTICESNHIHGITNNSNENVEIVALVIYE